MSSTKLSKRKQKKLIKQAEKYNRRLAQSNDAKQVAALAKANNIKVLKELKVKKVKKERIKRSKEARDADYIKDVNTRYDKANELHAKDTSRVVYKNGRINRRIYNDLLTKQDDEAVRDKITEVVNNSVKNKQELSLRSLEVKASVYSKTEILLRNMGWSMKDFSEAYDISVEDLDDPKNWHSVKKKDSKDGKRTDYLKIKDKYYKVEFKYEDQVLTEMTPEEVAALPKEVEEVKVL